MKLAVIDGEHGEFRVVVYPFCVWGFSYCIRDSSEGAR
jgi:hypothetical protein